MATLSPTINHIFKTLAPHTLYDAYRLTDKNNEIQVNNIFFLIKPGHEPNTIDGIELVQKVEKTYKPLAFVTYNQITAFYNFLENHSYNTSSFADIKKNLYWQYIYGVDYKPFEKLDTERNGKQTLFLESTFCRGKCGLLLPLLVLTVDYLYPLNNPQVGRGAILRFFSGLGLTEGAPIEMKDRATGSQLPDVGGSNNLHRTGDRKVLNAAGCIYYSIFRVFDQIESLNTACLHHIMNLQPMCGPCNSASQHYRKWGIVIEDPNQPYL